MFGFYGLTHTVSALIGLGSVARFESLYGGDFHRDVARSRIAGMARYYVRSPL